TPTAAMITPGRTRRPRWLFTITSPMPAMIAMAKSVIRKPNTALIAIDPCSSSGECSLEPACRPYYSSLPVCTRPQDVGGCSRYTARMTGGVRLNSPTQRRGSPPPPSVRRSRPGCGLSPPARANWYHNPARLPEYGQIGPLTFRTYTVLLDIAVLLGLALLVWQGHRRDARPLAWLDTGLAALVGGIIGARLVHAAIHWEYFSEHPIEIAEVWRGGLSWQGAVVGGPLAPFVAARLSRP